MFAAGDTATDSARANAGGTADAAVAAGTEVERETETADTGGFGGSEPLVVDVRTPEEFNMGAVQGAVNVPLDDIGSYVEHLGQKDREITLYCASGARSAYAVRMLQQAGFSNVYNGGGLMDMMARSRG